MTKPRLSFFLFFALVTTAAHAQPYQNFENDFLFGAADGGVQIFNGIGDVGSRPGFTDTVGFAFQVVRESAVGLWVEPVPIVIEAPSQYSALPGFSSGSSILFTPSARLMVPVHSRISIFGAAGGGVGHFHSYALASSDAPYLRSYGTYHGVVDFGFGADFRIARHFSIRLDIRDYQTGDNLGGYHAPYHIVPMLGFALHY
jgi:hypothetical protein